MSLAILRFISRDINIRSNNPPTRAGGGLQCDAHGAFGRRVLDVICIPGDGDGDAGECARCGKECAYVASAGGGCCFEDDEAYYCDEEVCGVDVPAALDFVGDVS